MLKFIKIRNSYGRRIIGELSINEQALLEYEKFCLELMNQAEKQKEVIDKLKKKIKAVKQYDFDKVGRYELLDILKEVSE